MMDTNIYGLLVLFLFVIRIIITVYCINKAGSLKLNVFGWGLFGFIFPLVAFIWIQFKKAPSHNKDPKSKDLEKDDAKVTDTEDLNFIKNQKKSLLDLKYADLLTENEYNEKMQILFLKEVEAKNRLKEVEAAKTEEQLTLLVNEQIEPMVKKLEELRKAGIISQDEFNQKKSQYFSDNLIQLQNNPCKRIDLDKLLDWQKRAVRDYYLSSNGENIILFKRGRNIISSFTPREFNELKLKNEIHDYYSIVLPIGFNPKDIK